MGRILSERIMPIKKLNLQFLLPIQRLAITIFCLLLGPSSIILACQLINLVKRRIKNLNNLFNPTQFIIMNRFANQ